MLSKENRDLSTTRSFEIPHLGGVFCAERTSEHLELYRENEDAVFWSSPEECAEKCADLLNDEERRKRIAVNGRKRCLQNGTTNEEVLTRILQTALRPEAPEMNTAVTSTVRGEGHQFSGANV